MVKLLSSIPSKHWPDQKPVRFFDVKSLYSERQQSPQDTGRYGEVNLPSGVGGNAQPLEN